MTAPRPVAAPPDAGGNQGSKTRGRDTEVVSPSPEKASPPLNTDTSRRVPPQWGVGAGLVLVLVLIAAVLWVVFRWAVADLMWD